MEVGDLQVKPNEQTPDLYAHVTLRPPPGEPLRRFTLHDDVIVHEVISHQAFVFVRNRLERRPLPPQGPGAADA